MASIPNDHDLPGAAVLPAVADPEFDRMALLARRLLDAPVALVTLPTSSGQVFPGAAGVDATLNAARTNSLEYSYCKYVVQSARPMVVGDTLDLPEFAAALSTTEYGFRAYAGMPLRDGDGQVIGSLCVLDLRPRGWSTSQLEILADLAEACSSQLQLRVITARTAVTADRDRIGRQLGEGVVREMFSLSMTLGSLRAEADPHTATRLTYAIEAIDHVVLRIRNSVFDLAQ